MKLQSLGNSHSFKFDKKHNRRTTVQKPHAIFREGLWEWRVLRRNSRSAQGELDNPLATWYCAVRSPYTHGTYDMGDTYINDIPNHAVRIQIEDSDYGVDLMGTSQDRLDRLKSFVMDTDDPYETDSDEMPADIGLIFEVAPQGGKRES